MVQQAVRDALASYRATPRILAAVPEARVVGLAAFLTAVTGRLKSAGVYTSTRRL